MMNKYAQFINGNFQKIVSNDIQPDNIEHKNVVWLPYVENTYPNFNPALQTVISDYEVKNGNYELTHTVNYLPVSLARANIIGKIKQYAQDLIRQIFSADPVSPESLMVKEINVLARGIELLNKRDGGIQLTIEEEAEAASLLSVWGLVKNIRTESNNKEAQVLTMSAEELMTYDYTANWNI